MDEAARDLLGKDGQDSAVDVVGQPRLRTARDGRLDRRCGVEGGCRSHARRGG